MKLYGKRKVTEIATSALEVEKLFKLNTSIRLRLLVEGQLISLYKTAMHCSADRNT